MRFLWIATNLNIKFQVTQIPQLLGYAGYITSIKSENLFASTYGKITYGISQKDYVKGQDVPPEVRYKSMAQEQFVNQRQVL
jgi:hypothetical protein